MSNKKRDSTIGNKGIGSVIFSFSFFLLLTKRKTGFKAVFKISRTPSIHSNGFHFRFNSCDAKGASYVVPEWCDAPQCGSPKCDTRCDDVGGKCWEYGGWETRIVLPLREGLQGREVLREIRSCLNESTLLFLRRVRRIDVVDLIGVGERERERGFSFSLERKSDPLLSSLPSFSSLPFSEYERSVLKKMKTKLTRITYR